MDATINANLLPGVEEHWKKFVQMSPKSRLRTFTFRNIPIQRYRGCSCVNVIGTSDTKFFSNPPGNLDHRVRSICILPTLDGFLTACRRSVALYPLGEIHQLMEIVQSVPNAQEVGLPPCKTFLVGPAQPSQLKAGLPSFNNPMVEKVMYSAQTGRIVAIYKGLAIIDPKSEDSKPLRHDTSFNVACATFINDFGDASLVDERIIACAGPPDGLVKLYDIRSSKYHQALSFIPTSNISSSEGTVSNLGSSQDPVKQIVSLGTSTVAVVSAHGTVYGIDIRMGRCLLNEPFRLGSADVTVRSVMPIRSSSSRGASTSNDAAFLCGSQDGAVMLVGLTARPQSPLGDRCTLWRRQIGSAPILSLTQHHDVVVGATAKTIFTFELDQGRKTSQSFAESIQNTSIEIQKLTGTSKPVCEVQPITFTHQCILGNTNGNVFLVA